MINLLTIILFLIGMTIVLILSLMGKIHLSLLFLIPLFPLQNILERFHQFPFGKDFVDIILIAMILGWIFRSISNKERMFEPTPFNKILFVMGIFTYISLWQGSFYLNFSAPISPNDVRLQNWKNYMIFPLLFFVTVNNIKNLKQIKWLILAMAFGVLVVDYYTGNQIKWMAGLASRHKIDGTFVWAGVNVVAAFHAQYPFVFLGMFIMHKNKLFKIMCGALFIIGIYITLFLYSRGAYVAVITGLSAISLIKKRILLIPLVVLLLFWQSILPQNAVIRIKETKSEEGTLDSSTQHRLELWEESIRLFKENVFTGVGFNVFAFLGILGGFADTHNIYMKVLAEQGIIGMIIFLILFWLALKNGYKLYKTANDTFLKGLGLGFIACVIATMTTNFFGDRWTYLQLGSYYWVFLALVVRGNLITEQEKQQKKRNS